MTFRTAFPCFLAALLTAPALAAKPEERTMLSEYVRARTADVVGMPELAAAQYAKLLTARPDDRTLALSAYRQAIVAGDHALIRRSALLLDGHGTLPPDGRVLLLADAVKAKDWKRAGLLVDRIQEEDVFSFLVPALQAWVAFGTRDGDPLSRLDTASSPLAATYAAEQRVYLLLAMKRYDAAVAALPPLAGRPGGGRVLIIVANTLAAAKQRDRALALLKGDAAVTVSVRNVIARGGLLPLTMNGPAAGIAELLLRVGVDINRERLSPVSLALLRGATLLTPDNGAAWTLTAQMLAAGRQTDVALAAVDKVSADDPFFAEARRLRLGLLVEKGERDTALAEATVATRRQGAGVEDWTRLGDLQTELGRDADAAASYGTAVDLALAEKTTADQLWSLWLLRGGALEQSGQWPPARAALEKALALAPGEAVVLNYLGYAMLERQEDLPRAGQLIAEASRLKPDDAAITDSLGWAQYLRGDMTSATATLERAVAGAPGEAAINEHLGDVYWRTGRRIEARYAWRAALVQADTGESERLRRKIDLGLDATAAGRK